MNTLEQFVADHSDDDASEEEMEEIFRLAYGRQPEAEDERAGLWSLIVAAVTPSDEE